VILALEEEWWNDILDRVTSALDSAGSPRDWLIPLRDGDIATVQQQLKFCGAQKILEVDTHELPAGTDVWFIGDVHGDLLGLEAALGVIRRRSGDTAKIIFLGDLVDDGFHCAEVITRVIDLATHSAGLEISLLAGNHDEALYYDDGARVFKSRVSPGDFSVWLNDNAEWHELARAYITLVELLPRAIFFRHGLFTAHAGFPHSDTWERIHEAGGASCLQDVDMLKDFTWNRLAESKRKIPNRGTSGSTFGSSDFSGFCDVVSKALGYGIWWMVRGHDHVSDRPDRFSRPLQDRRAAYDGRILTVNNMCYALPRETGLDFGKVGFGRRPTIAHWRVEMGPPTPIAIDIPDEVLAQYVTSCGACGRAIPTRAQGFEHECPERSEALTDAPRKGEGADGP
jgi:hypothetical protein